jgi:tetraacyldisaccharide 4'-kinase
MKRSLIASTLSAPWNLVTWARNRLYDYNRFNISAADVPVVSIGNISLGGTGKSPLVMFLATELLAKRIPVILNAITSSSRKPAILLRGYHRKSKGFKLVSDGSGLLLDIEACGDEAAMFARKCPGVMVGVAESRVEGSRELVAKGADLILMDDGFQHRSLARDRNILLWDANIDPRIACLLPFGRLRESPKSAVRADSIVFSRTQDKEKLIQLQTWFDSINTNRTPFQYWVLLTSPGSFVEVNENGEPGGKLAAHDLLGKSLGAFCALGNREQFFISLKIVGDLKWSKGWSDHHWFDETDVSVLQKAQTENHLDYLVTTWKDFQRIPHNTGLKLLIANQNVELIELENFIG